MLFLAFVRLQLNLYSSACWLACLIDRGLDQSHIGNSTPNTNFLFHYAAFSGPQGMSAEFARK